VDVTVASPKGGHAPLDPSSVEQSKSDEGAMAFLKNQAVVWEQTRPLAEFAGRAGDFDAIFFPGGHGPMFDLAADSGSQHLTAEFAAGGKAVAAVCHGPAALLGVRGAGGKLLLEGKRVTGFSDAEEEASGYTKFMPFSLETRLGEVSGGGFVKADESWGEKVVVDGQLITGQNPASAKGVGEAILKAIGA